MMVDEMMWVVARTKVKVVRANSLGHLENRKRELGRAGSVVTLPMPKLAKCIMLQEQRIYLLSIESCKNNVY